MGSAQSARRIQPGGRATRPAGAGAVGSPPPPPLRPAPSPGPGRAQGGRAGRGPPPVRRPAPVGRISSAAVRRDRLRDGREGPPAGRWPGAARAVRRALEPPGPDRRRIPGPRDRTDPPRPPPGRWRGARGGFASSRLPPAFPSFARFRAGVGGRARRPPAPAFRAGADCAQCAPGARRRRAGLGPRSGARGPRRRRLPTRPVLKHGPRSPARARVGGSRESPRRNEGEGRRAPAEVGSRGGVSRSPGRTTGPSRPPRRGGGARARVPGPERW